MNTQHIVTSFLSVLIIGLLNGCESTIQVRTLADKTAANIGTISVHLRHLTENSRDIAEKRAANISRLHAANAELRARYEYDVALTKKTGGSSNLRLIDDIEGWRKEVDTIFDKAKDAEAERKKAVLTTQKKLDTKSKALAEIAQALATLAQEEKPKDRIRFLTGYSKSLKAELDVALEKDNETAQAAKKLIDETKETMKAGIGKAKSRLN